MSDENDVIEMKYFWHEINNVPCLVTSIPANYFGPDRVKLFIELISQKLDPSIPLVSLARGVDGSKLKSVLANGIDVNPTSAPIYAENILKAEEYGDSSNQLILLYKKEKLSPTWVQVSVNSSESELAEIQKNYPTKILLEGSDKYWFSRRKANEPQVASGYEELYSYWCPGNPWDAL